jgi:hypothetical protein
VEASLKLLLLRIVLISDAVVLVVLGVLLLAASPVMFSLFGLGELAPSAQYIAGMWGALMATMGLGYALAAREPGSSQSWVLAGIIRAVLELGVSTAYLSSGVVSLRSAGLGLALALWFALAYAVLYPRAQAQTPAGQSTEGRG